jgi:hypothetical protein
MKLDNVARKVWESMRGSVNYSIMGSVYDSMEYSVWDSVRDSAHGSVDDSIQFFFQLFQRMSNEIK